MRLSPCESSSQMADDSPLERLHAEDQLRAAARNSQRAAPVHNPKPTTLEEEYRAQVEAGLHANDDIPPAEPARLPSTARDRDIAANVADAVFKILSTP